MKSITVSIAFMASMTFVLGLWEASVAHQHEPTSADSPGYIQGYVFTVVSAVMNVMAGVVMTCSTMIRHEESESSNSIFPCILGIWSIVLFAGMTTGDILTGPFEIVVIVQFAITLFGAFLVVCSCCLITCIMSRVETDAPATENDLAVEV